MQQLPSRAAWLFFFRSLIVLLFLTFFIGVFIAGFIAEIGAELGLSENALASVGTGFFLVLLALAVLFFIWAKLSAHFYRYELRSDGFRKEHGVINKKYVTIPYSKIQNVDINRGLLARILGLSDLHIQTAGASATVGRYGMQMGGAEGMLPGLEINVAEELRDELIKRSEALR